ncbi:unnamed protein product [Urochloa humidicola]
MGFLHEQVSHTPTNTGASPGSSAVDPATSATDGARNHQDRGGRPLAPPAHQKRRRGGLPIAVTGHQCSPRFSTAVRWSSLTAHHCRFASE